MGWGVGGLGWGVVGGTPHTHAHTHACMVNMIISCKWPPPWGNPWEFPIMSYVGAHVCMHVHVHMCGAPSHQALLPSTHPQPPRGDPRNQSKFNSTWTIRDILILFEDLKTCGDSPTQSWVYSLVGGWVGCVGWWVGSGQITKNLKMVDWTKIIQFCLKIYDL